MRVMVLVKATEQSEAGQMPTAGLFEEMGAFNRQLVDAGVMLDGDGLRPSSAGKRMVFAADGSSEILDGPFAETKELVSGYWIWQVSSMDEALQWLGRAPFRDGIVEVRPFFQPSDFGDLLTPAQQADERSLRERIAGPATA